MCSTRKFFWKFTKKPLKLTKRPPKRCFSNIFSFLATCLILASWKLQNREFSEHSKHWKLCYAFISYEGDNGSLLRLRIATIKSFLRIREHRFKHRFHDILDPFYSCRTNLKQLEIKTTWRLPCSNYVHERH